MFLGLRASRSLAPRALAAPRRAAPALRAARRGDHVWRSLRRRQDAGHGEMVQHRQGLRLHHSRGRRRRRRLCPPDSDLRAWVPLARRGRRSSARSSSTKSERQRAISVAGPRATTSRGRRARPAPTIRDAKYDGLASGECISPLSSVPARARCLVAVLRPYRVAQVFSFLIGMRISRLTRWWSIDTQNPPSDGIADVSIINSEVRCRRVRKANTTTSSRADIIHRRLLGVEAKTRRALKFHNNILSLTARGRG